MSVTQHPSLHMEPRMTAPGQTIMLVPQPVSLSLQARLPADKLALVCQSVESLLADTRNRVVYFASPYDREGAGVVAFESAIVAATQLGRRVLFLDLSDTQDRQRQVLVEACGMAAGHGALEMRVVAVAGTSLSYACAFEGGRHATASFNPHFLKDFIAASRPSCDLLIVFSGAAINSSVAASCAEAADGVVLVVEAERTRGPVAKQVKEMLERNGGRVIGAVMTRRRFYIPRLVYALFFRTLGRKG